MPYRDHAKDAFRGVLFAWPLGYNPLGRELPKPLPSLRSEYAYSAGPFVVPLGLLLQEGRTPPDLPESASPPTSNCWWPFVVYAPFWVTC